MEYVTSKGNESLNDVIKLPHNNRNIASNKKQEIEWNMGSALPLFLYSPLGTNSSIQARARFIESVLFAFVVFCVIVSAAIPGILY